LRLVLAAAAFGGAMALAALAPSLAGEILALTLVGAASIAFMSTANATLQLRAAPEMRGRVMALWFVGFQGSTPIGAPIIGGVMATFGARAGLGAGALTCFLVALSGAVFLARRGTPLVARGSAAAAPSEPMSSPGSHHAGTAPRGHAGTGAARRGLSASAAPRCQDYRSAAERRKAGVEQGD
jgi:MFS family permease